MPTPLKDHCRKLPGTSEDLKWGEHLVFSVGGQPVGLGGKPKMYAIFDEDNEKQFSLKVDEDDFEDLTEIEGIIPAPYLRSLIWVKIENPRALSAAEKKRLLTKAHALIVAQLSKKSQRALGFDPE